MPLASLIRRGTSYFTHNSSDTVTSGTLFPVVTTEEDGEDCTHDCEGCPGYGRAFDKQGVETESQLWGGIKAYDTHVVIATGESDWIRDVEDIKGSLMEALDKEKKRITNGKLKISASNLPPPHDYHTALDSQNPSSAPTNVILLPSFTLIENVKPTDAPALIENFINHSPTTKTPLPAVQIDTEKPTPDVSVTATTVPPAVSDPNPSVLSSSPYPHDTLILLCSHRRRDARCGISAPILRKEFERQLHPLGLWRDLSDNRPGGAKVVFINHVGGHKFAANVIIYRKQPGQADGEGLQGIWLARVMPKHVEGIVKYTILQGKIVHPDMIRGGFNRLTGTASW